MQELTSRLFQMAGCSTLASFLWRNQISARLKGSWKDRTQGQPIPWAANVARQFHACNRAAKSHHVDQTFCETFWDK